MEDPSESPVTQKEPTQTELSVESSPLLPQQQETVVEVLSKTENAVAKVAKLVDLEKIQRLTKNVFSRIEHRKGEVIAKKTVPFMSSTPEVKRIYIPEGLLTCDTQISGLIISMISHFTDIELYTFTSEVNCTTQPGYDAWWDGFLIGSLSPTKSVLTRKNGFFEDGKACAFAWKIKGWAESTNNVGALRRNNYYFGNNPTETTGKGKDKVAVPYGARVNFFSSFSNPDVARAIFSIMRYLLGRLGLEQYTPDDISTILTQNCVTFDDVVVTCYEPIRKPRKNKREPKGEILKYRKGALPSKSPVLMPWENDLIKKLLSPYFSILDSIRSSFQESLYTIGYHATRTIIQEHFNIRFELLRNFAAMTTKRLQDIRKVTNKPRLTKKDVSRPDIELYFASLQSPAKHFSHEVGKILGKVRQLVLSAFASQEGAIEDNFTVDDLLFHVIVDSFAKNEQLRGLDELPEWFKKPYSVPDSIGLLEGCCKTFTNTLNRIREIDALLAHILVLTYPKYIMYCAEKFQKTLNNAIQSLNEYLEYDVITRKNTESLVLTKYYNEWKLNDVMVVHYDMFKCYQLLSKELGEIVFTKYNESERIRCIVVRNVKDMINVIMLVTKIQISKKHLRVSEEIWN